MRKAIVVALVLGMIFSGVFAKQWKPMFGGGLGFNLVNTSSDYGDDSDFGFVLRAEGMAPVYQSLYARASLLALRVGDVTNFSFGTGSAFDLVYFIPARNIEPYAVGGMNIEVMSGEGYSQTTFGIAFGGGVQLQLRNAPVKPYGELLLGLGTISSDYTDYTTFEFSMLFGLRFGGR
ncbi:hypothetical protein DRQ33_03695 [bacterium]|nr:MAG: hypothetical protein DRQ33_03695 [bacterium]